MQFWYTRLILILAALGLISTIAMGAGNIYRGQVVGGVVAILLAAFFGYFWVQDWQTLGKCASALDRVQATTLSQ